MANAPSHSRNSAIDTVVVFDDDGKELVVTRLNAIDLVRGGKHYWKSVDVKADRPEADGPADPTAKTVVIYDADGKEYEMSQANARDMVNSEKYFWNNPEGSKEAAALDAVIEATEAAVTAEAEPTTVDADIDVNKEPLAEQAMRVAGSDDVVKYLEGFSEENLRDMAQQRYGLKVHHRASKETAIVKIVEAENDAQVVSEA